MREYMAHIFFDHNGVDFKDIISWARERSYDIHVDKLDCNISMSRQITEVSIDEFLIMMEDEKTTHNTIIHRRGYNERWNLEVGCTTFSRKDHQVSYFLWIHCDEKYINEIIVEFKLKEL